MNDGAMVKGSKSVVSEVPWWRSITVLLGALSAGAAMPLFLMDKEFVPWVLIAASIAILSTGAMAFSKKLSVQLLARSIWWQLALYCVVLIGGAFYYDGAVVLRDFWPVWAMLGGSVAALLAGGKLGLEQESALFAPAGFKFMLMTSLILAMADTQALLFYAGIHMEDGARIESVSIMSRALPFLGAAAVMAVGLFGLYRLKIWGLVLNIVANVGIAALALSGVFDLPGILAGTLAATAILQLLIPAPLVYRMVREVRKK